MKCDGEEKKSGFAGLYNMFHRKESKLYKNIKYSLKKYQH